MERARLRREESRRAVCAEKWPEAQAEQVASVHVFSSQEGAETIPRGGGSFLSSDNSLVFQPVGSPRRRRRAPRCFRRQGSTYDAEGELSSRCAHVSGSESADTSSLASFKTASRTRQLTAATSASWSISSRTCCQCGRSARSLPIAAIYSHASKIVRSVPPSFVGMGG
jgi:hypothetical protein